MESLLEGWGRFVARWPLVIILAWIVLLGAGLRFAPSIQAVADKENISSLPASAPSQRAQALYNGKFPGAEQAARQESGVIILVDPAGVSSADVAPAQRTAAYLNAPATRPAHVVSVVAPGPRAPLAAFESADHQAQRLPITWDTTNDNTLSSSVTTIDAYLARQSAPHGATLGLVASAAVTHDVFSNNFGGLNIGLLVSLLIILIVLGYVYRSPLAVIIPLLVIGVAFLAATAASFSRAIASPILELAESAFAITIGALIDTFLVRPLLVPAIVTLLGRWNWVWPGRPLRAPTTLDAH